MVNTQNKNRKNIKICLLCFFGAILLLVSVIFEYYRCPFNYFFGVPCPLCGMSRALISVLNFKFKKAFYYHAFWPIVLIALPFHFFIKIVNIRISKKLVNTICIILGILLLSYYLLRHYYSSPIVEIHFEDSLIYRLVKRK